MASKRQFARFRPDDPEVWLLAEESGLKVRGEVVNESYGGLGIQCDDAAGLQKGMKVAVDFQGGVYDAEVAAIWTQEGDTHVGIRWLVEESDETDEGDVSDGEDELAES